MGGSGNPIETPTGRNNRRVVAAGVVCVVLVIGFIWLVSRPVEPTDAGGQLAQTLRPDPGNNSQQPPNPASVIGIQSGPVQDQLQRLDPPPIVDELPNTPSLQDLLNTRYCYNRGEKAVIENPNANTADDYEQQIEALKKRLKLTQQKLEKSSDPAHLSLRNYVMRRKNALASAPTKFKTT